MSLILLHVLTQTVVWSQRGEMVSAWHGSWLLLCSCSPWLTVGPSVLGTWYLASSCKQSQSALCSSDITVCIASSTGCNHSKQGFDLAFPCIKAQRSIMPPKPDVEVKYNTCTWARSFQATTAVAISQRSRCTNPQYSNAMFFVARASIALNGGFLSPKGLRQAVITRPARQHIFRLRIDNRTRTLSQIAASLLPVDPCCFGGQATRTNNQVRVWVGVRSITELRKLMTKERALPKAFWFADLSIATSMIS